MPPAVRVASSGSLRQAVHRVAGLVATPLIPADFLDIFDPLRSGADLRGRIVAVHPEARDAVTLVIEPGRGWHPHLPGQYARIGVDVDGVRQWRSYSITSSRSSSDGCFTVTVKAIPGGTVSNYLVRRARVGTILQLDRPAGQFVLPAVLPERALFVTAGSGITPVMGILRNAGDGLHDAVVVHSARTASEVLFAGELRDLAGQGRIRLIERHTGADGRLGIEEMVGLVPDLIDRQAWACGPVGLLDMLEQHWSAHGVIDRLHIERFRPKVVAAGERGTVTFTRSGRSVEAGDSTVILDVGERAGVLMPSGCRMGICFGCVAPLRDGAVRDVRSGVITAAAPGDAVLVQTCVSTAAGACVIDL